MNRFNITLLLFMLLLQVGHAQIAHDFMIGGQMDLIKTDNTILFEKAQFGTEFNYFFDKSFSATAGVEIWSMGVPSFVLGGRFYPLEHFFLRVRGLIGENEMSLGAGWSKNFMDNWRFEAVGDFYFSSEFAARAGIAYLIRRKP